MSTATLTALVLRVWGLIVLAGTVRSCPVNVFMLTLSRRGLFPWDSARVPGVIAAFATAAVLILLADYIVYFAGVRDSPAPDVDLPRLVGTCFAVVALWAIVAGVRYGVVEAFALAGALPRDISVEMASEFRIRQGQAVAGSVMSIVAGVVILRRDRVAGALSRVAAAAKGFHDPPIKE